MPVDKPAKSAPSDARWGSDYLADVMRALSIEYIALTPGANQAIDLQLHGPVTELASPARTGARDGAAVALSPGTSDATTRLPGPGRAPSAGLLTVSGTTWRWRPIADRE